MDALLVQGCPMMPYNKSYEEADEEGQASDTQRNNAPPHDAAPKPDENTLLQGGVDTYFSDERILIPENEKVIRRLAISPIDRHHVRATQRSRSSAQVTGRQ